MPNLPCNKPDCQKCFEADFAPLQPALPEEVVVLAGEKPMPGEEPVFHVIEGGKGNG